MQIIKILADKRLAITFSGMTLEKQTKQNSLEEIWENGVKTILLWDLLSVEGCERLLGLPTSHICMKLAFRIGSYYNDF